MSSQWNDDGFLDCLRAQADARADATVAELIESHGIARANAVFARLAVADDPIEDDVPAALQAFFDATGDLPPDADHDRLDRGADAFMERAATGSIVLLASSLPQGYASPSLCEILSMSGNLASHPYKRLMGVVQLLVNLSTRDAFRPGGQAIINAQKLRLLHAGVRHLAARHRPDYCERFGAPVNHEDMLATIMAFSLLVVEGFKRLDLHFPDAEDYYYSWRVFALLMGIHPPGDPSDDSLVPADLTAAREFYASYSRRHFTGPEENPNGPVLAAQNLAMMKHLIPAPLRKLGFARAPRVVMTELLDADAMARVEIEPARHHHMLEKLLEVGLSVGERVAGRAPHLVELLARHTFQDMIDHARGREVTFIIPDSLDALRGEGLV